MIGEIGNFKMKKLLLILLCLPLIGFGQCISGDCSNGFGEYRFPNGDIFKGNWRGGLMHGEGTYTSDDGTMIKSNWENGLEAPYVIDDVVLENEIEFEDTESDEDVEIEIEKEDDDEEVFMVVETMPVFCNYVMSDINTVIEYCGDEALMKYIQKNVKYPPIAKEYNITGKVYASFIVDKSGSVTNVKVVRGIDKDLDAETVRVIKSMPKYTPGTQKGKPVRVMFTMPINFTLN
jgi:TonB family protein